VTTIGGNLDVHVYDIARIESLAGPQGTLYGASSEAGTIRIITNKPDTTALWQHRCGSEHRSQGRPGRQGGRDGQHPAVARGAACGRLLRARCRLYRQRGRLRASCRQSARLPARQNGGINNNQFVKKNYNDTEISGGRAALKVDLDDNWTVTPTVMYQDTKSHGSYGYDPRVGDLQVQHFLPEYRSDIFVQAALTIEGKIGNWDVTYAGAYLDRKDSSRATTPTTPKPMTRSIRRGRPRRLFLFQDNAGNHRPISGVRPDHFKKMSHELRIASPERAGARGGGLFYQRQSNLIHQDYQVAGLAPTCRSTASRVRCG
jgi:hypothetical protein